MTALVKCHYVLNANIIKEVPLKCQVHLSHPFSSWIVNDHAYFCKTSLSEKCRPAHRSYKKVQTVMLVGQLSFKVTLKKKKRNVKAIARFDNIVLFCFVFFWRGWWMVTPGQWPLPVAPGGPGLAKAGDRHRNTRSLQQFRLDHPLSAPLQRHWEKLETLSPGWQHLGKYVLWEYKNSFVCCLFMFFFYFWDKLASSSCWWWCFFYFWVTNWLFPYAMS